MAMRKGCENCLEMNGAFRSLTKYDDEELQCGGMFVDLVL